MTLDWPAVLQQISTSRALDDLEESFLFPERKILYQFSARGHELTQVVLGNHGVTGSLLAAPIVIHQPRWRSWESVK